MLTYFPKYFTSKAIYCYLALLIVVPLTFGYPMEWYFWIFGVVEVIGFFYFTNKLTVRWQGYSSEKFQKKVFWTSFVIRVVYVLFSYWFYTTMTGEPFEYGVADAWNYHQSACSGADMITSGKTWAYFYLVHGADISDSGYVTYLIVNYLFFGKSILMARLVKAFLLAMICVLVYRLASRNFGERTGRMAAIFCMLMPNLIYYCGLHLKEAEMVFLIVLFIERADLVLRGEKIKFWPMTLVAVIGLSLFTFRTVLGSVAFLSLFTAIVFTSKRVMGWSKKILVGTLALGFLFMAMSDSIIREVTELWENRDSNQKASMEWRTKREGGNEFAKYAGAAVFAPMIFTIPFPTLVATPNQENQRLIHGGNYVKNITSFFTILALFLLVISGQWRQHVLLLSFTLGYLAVIAFSAFAQSERFHLPALPFAMILAAYGVSQMQNKYKRWYMIWLGLIFVINIAWAWFKLRGRGL